MCTVSFISIKGKTIITSNRDENIQREKAAAPSVELLNNKRIFFPKDSKAGGTWFAASDKAVIAVLLNGAFVKHTASPPYRKSRGLVLLEIIEADDPFLFFKKMALQDIEPFTVILYQPAYLYELRWDGNKKHELKLNILQNYIWSSATLYTDEVIQHRKNLFNRFISDAEIINPGSIYQFHAKNNRDDENGFIINRQTGMKTFSITQAVLQHNSISFLHNDLLTDQKFEATMHINPVPVNL